MLFRILASFLMIAMTASAAPPSFKPAQSQRKELEQTASAFKDVAQSALPAVVGITAYKKARIPFPFLPFALQDEGSEPPPGGNESEDSEEVENNSEAGPGGPFNPEEMQPLLGLGSGIVIRSDGYILTNFHVVEDAEKITITFDDRENERVEGKLVGADPRTDLAVIRPIFSDQKKKEPTQRPFPTLEFDRSETAKVGDWAIAIGNPFGLSRSVSSGIISAIGHGKSDVPGLEEIDDFIQTDAAINPGSSGGPLLNLDGKVIGINTAIFSQGEGFVGIGFAIPSKTAKVVAEQLIARGKVTRGWLGVQAQDLTPELAQFFKVPNERNKSGAVISSVSPNGPAGKSKLRAGDVVLKFGNQSIQNASQLQKEVDQARAGSTIPLSLIRDGRTMNLNIRIEEQPSPVLAALPPHGMAGQAADSSKKPIGIGVEDIPIELSALLEVKPGAGALVTSVDPGSPAFEANLTPGDVILKANQKLIGDANDFLRAAKRSRETQSPLILYVQRSPSEKVFVPLKW